MSVLFVNRQSFISSQHDFQILQQSTASVFQLSNNKDPLPSNMKFSLAITATMAASAVASPIWDKDWSWSKHGKDKGTPYHDFTFARPPNTFVAAAKDIFPFTSTYHVIATPDQVVDTNNTFTGGLAGAKGLYKLGINSAENTICYNITLYDFQGNYQSPALTATHLHEAVKGKAGPPRIAFPNPTPIGGNLRRSVGCLVGPFKTGLNVTGTQTDTGATFHVSQIEANPKGFFADVHSSLAVAGAVRGQLA